MPLAPRCLATLISFILFLGWRAMPAQTAGPSTTSSSLYKVVRSISGSSGHEDGGRYVMDDPKSVFTVGKDTKVTVYFEWEGPLGPHHFEGLWKSPEGKIVLISDFRYEAKGPRYSGYWSMLLSDSVPSGEWNLEARIDGEPAGTHSFVVTGSAAAAAPAAPRILTSAELYNKALDATVAVEKLGPDGAVLGKGTGFWIAEGKLLTAFSVIDGSASLRILLQNGNQVSTDQVLSWNRWQDWALVKVDGGGKSWLNPGPHEPANVGYRCVLLEMGPMGAKLADGSITGKNTFPRAGERLLVASGITTQSFGGPLLDEYGNYVGIVGGSILPGGDPIKTLMLLSEGGSNSLVGDWQTTGLAVPQTLLPDLAAAAAPVRLAELASRGEMLAPVVKSDSIRFASLASAATRSRTGGFTANEYKRVFTQRDKSVTVFVSWQASAKTKLNSTLRVFTVDNKVIDESKAREIVLSPGRYVETTWDIPVGALATGVYRVDLVLNDKTAWRDFFRIAD